MKNEIDFVWWSEMLMLGIAAFMVIIFGASIASCESIEDVEAFLVNDTTDTHEWLTYYSCGYFSRELSYNASLHNVSVGSIILGNHKTLQGKYNSHIMNYVIIENKIYLIEAQTDEISTLNQTMYNYYRLYPDGTQVPSNWDCNLATKPISAFHGLIQLAP